MAGFIFAISGEEGIDGVRNCIKDGVYISKGPSISETGNNLKSKQVLSSILADYCSMKAGDNIYFLSKRKIYGVGKLVNIQGDCKYKNYITANNFNFKKELSPKDNPIKELEVNYRWICFFEPCNRFYQIGVDMDDVLQYQPSAFKMLRAFQDSTFIKIDDKENQALKECILLKNRKNLKDDDLCFEFDSSFHEELERKDMESYRIDMREVFSKEKREEKLSLEMVLEAGIVDKIMKNGFDDVRYDYVTHQVIASPFKPLAYIDKMDIFAYKYLDIDEEVGWQGGKPIDKYLVIELKKDKANGDTLLQLMRYVDWISKEYASGDYSLIKAVSIASGYNKKIYPILKNDCTRKYLSETHPNKTEMWNDVELYTYEINGDNELKLIKEDKFDVLEELKDILDRLGLEYSKTAISIEGIQYLPTLKVLSNKWVFFKDGVFKDRLEEKGWKICILNDVCSKDELYRKISELI